MPTNPSSSIIEIFPTPLGKFEKSKIHLKQFHHLLLPNISAKINVISSIIYSCMSVSLYLRVRLYFTFGHLTHKHSIRKDLLLVRGEKGHISYFTVNS